ncbi:MAG: gfo/Idh/MocA family oxidoreductase [Balneolaceae bacterium]|nr:MAG: gfo/Idh/MocA family oxidoreductase [Balneolaceae bacterium]
MSDERKLRFGIAGLGNIAATHAKAIQSIENTGLSAAFSRSEANRSRFSQSFGVPAYSSFDELLSHSPLDAIVICTPSGTHLDYGKAAAEAGKHVIVEKPIEVTVARGKELIHACKQNGVKLAVIYQNRFLDGAVKMKRVVEDGTIGEPVMVRASVKWFRDQAYYENSGWRGTYKMDGGGAVINQAIHTIDLLLWIMGDIAELSALKGTLTHRGIEAEDNAVAVLQFKNGAMGVFEASTSIVPAQPRSIEINGTMGTAILKDDQFTLIFDKANQLSAVQKTSGGAGAADPLDGLQANLHASQYAGIVDAILYDKPPEVSGEDALRSLAVAEAIYRSAENKMFVEPVVNI